MFFSLKLRQWKIMFFNYNGDIIETGLSIWNIPLLNKQNMLNRSLFLLLFFISAITILQADCSCMQYKAGICIRCNSEQTVFNGKCIKSIYGCLEYFNKTTCKKCEGSRYTLQKGVCIDETNSLTDLRLTLLQLAGIGDFQAISLQTLQSQTTFSICDKFLRQGQYQHFISKTSQPIHFVGIRRLQQWNSFQIIYDASGGGLLLCLVNVDRSSSAVVIQSIVSISSGKIVDRCLSYSVDTQCRFCEDGYHLEGGRCFRDVEGCIGYVRNLCVSCDDNLVLVENRCVGGCEGSCDMAKIAVYPRN